MRGEHASADTKRGLTTRIIPACAGSTSLSSTSLSVRVGSSPHARGALTHSWTRVGRSGDHPRMRGEHLGMTDERNGRDGIIPACAGSTMHSGGLGKLVLGSSPHARGAPSTTGASIMERRDHPRMRGEHQPQAALVLHPAGIIPACAGSTKIRRENKAAIEGSSPHARGARRRGTPRTASAWDHPRMRGEHGLERVVNLRHAGIIPACAGSTCSTSRRDRAVLGSSPHARGALHASLQVFVCN